MKSESTNAVSVYTRILRLPSLLVMSGILLTPLHGCSLFQETPSEEADPALTSSVQSEDSAQVATNRANKPSKQLLPPTTADTATRKQESVSWTDAVARADAGSRPANASKKPASEPLAALAPTATPPRNAEAQAAATMTEQKSAAAETVAAAAKAPVQPEPATTNQPKMAKAEVTVKTESTAEKKVVAAEPAKAPANQLAVADPDPRPTLIDDQAESDESVIEAINQAPAPAAGGAEKHIASAPAPAATAATQATSRPTQAVSLTPEVLAAIPAKDEQLLGSYGSWELTRSWHGNQSVCRLSTHTMQIDDSQFSSQIWVNVEPGQLVLNASSDIKLSTRGTGIRLDQGQLIPFTGQAIPTHAVLSDDLINRLEKSQTLHLYVRVGDMQPKVSHAEVNLRDLRAALGDYRKCVQ